MADDDRAVMERLAALEAEVKADADAQRARKAAAIAKLRDQRVTKTARDESTVRNRALRRAAVAANDDDESDAGAEIEPPVRRSARMRSGAGDASHLEDLGGALELASKANRVKHELQRTPGKGEKSWIVSGAASLVLGPIGWLYAGSLREAVPATVGWVALALIASKILPVFLLMPVLMLALPLSAIAGVVYALQYNRSGKRQRLFDRDDKDKPKQLRGGRSSI